LLVRTAATVQRCRPSSSNGSTLLLEVSGEQQQRFIAAVGEPWAGHSEDDLHGFGQYARVGSIAET
jgi:hypothetical protein